MFENTNIFIRMIFNTDFRQYSLGWLKSLTNYLERTISNLSFLFYWYFPRDIAFCINFKIETQFINLVFSTHIKIFTNHMCYWESSPLFLLNPVFIGTILQIKKIWAFPSIFHPQLYNRLHSLEVMVLKKKKKAIVCSGIAVFFQILFLFCREVCFLFFFKLLILNLLQCHFLIFECNLRLKFYNTKIIWVPYFKWQSKYLL